LLTELEKQEIQSKQYQQEIELAKFHEERGKLNCNCYSCEEKKVIHKEIKAKVFVYSKKYNKEQCPQCKKFFKELDEENGICAKCLNQYEN
jgi:hypothetical protein